MGPLGFPQPPGHPSPVTGPQEGCLGPWSGAAGSSSLCPGDPWSSCNHPGPRQVCARVCAVCTRGGVRAWPGLLFLSLTFSLAPGDCGSGRFPLAEPWAIPRPPHQGQNPGPGSLRYWGRDHTLRSPQDPLWGSCPLPASLGGRRGLPSPAQTEEQEAQCALARPPPTQHKHTLQMFQKQAKAES